jgi:hypothetical protein
MMKDKFYRNINSVGSDDPNILAEFNYQLGVYYQLALAKLRNYKTQKGYTFSTTAQSQYYPYPPGEITVESVVITVGSVNYPLQIISSQYLWDRLNAIMIQASALPQFYFPTRDGVGIWPIPQATYSGVMNYHYRDRNMLVEDVDGGSVTVTNGSATVERVGDPIFTSAMVGRWFEITDQDVPGAGYWYRVEEYVDGNEITLERTWVGETATTFGWLIGETPDIPEEGHQYLVDGATGGFYNEFRKDLESGQAYLNKYFTGDPGNSNRNFGDNTVQGGIIGLVNTYADRDDQKIIKRQPELNPLVYKAWATSLS